MGLPSEDRRDFLAGVRACREENWWDGLHRLGRLARDDTSGRLPGVFYTYYGLALARCQGLKRQGLDLCLYGAEAQPFLPENHVNTARAYLLLHRRRDALVCLRRAHQLDPDHAGANDLRRRLGVRRPPALPFLPRQSLPNRLLGRITWEIGERRRRSRLARARRGG